MEGYIKLYRILLDNPIACKDSDYFAVWVYLLLRASHASTKALFCGKTITLQSGQLITGRKSISQRFMIDENKVQRILKTFENEHQIKQQTSNKNRLITVVNWEKYQACEQPIEQQLNNRCTTDEQQVNTNKNVKNERMKEKDIKAICASQQKKTDVIELFESLWKLYPVKRGKAAVSYTKQQVLFTIGYEPMRKAIERYQLDLQKDVSWRKPQNGSTFFNGGYQDYLEETYTPPKDDIVNLQRPKKTGFQNFEQRDDVDYDKMALERLKDRLGGK